MYSQGFAIAGILSVLIWAYLLLARGRFWQVDRTVVFSKLIPNFSRVAVVLPARNEEGVVARCITSLLEQTCWESIHIFLVDDFSSDSTIAVTREAAERAGKSALLTVTACGPLPSGWTGKLWAVREGIEEASLFNPKYVLLTDADMVHDPQSIATLLQIAESGGYDLVSVTGRSECETLAERLLMPAFTFFFLMLYPPTWIEDPRRKTAGADGGCILIRSDALARVGGVESIRHEVIDDCALARTIKRSGGKLYMGVSNLTASVRGHESFSQMGRVISRTAFSQLRHSTLLLLATLVGLAITYVLPVVMTFSNIPVLMALGMSAWAVMTLCYFPVVRFYGLKPQWSLTLPIAVLFYMAATLWSALRFWSSKGGEWKERVQDPAVRATFQSREDMGRH
jgi:hopene-associated glycosyltransferase HpnB